MQIYIHMYIYVCEYEMYAYLYTYSVFSYVYTYFTAAMRIPAAAHAVQKACFGASARSPLMTLVRDEARSHFYPAQLGVAVPGGVEIAIHTVRAWYDRHQGCSQKVALKLDFSNAFNTVRREAVLSAVTANFPGLSRWATWCYRQPTRLQFAEWVVESSSGVQQGDPLGPLLFAAALQPIARDLRQAGLDIAVHYLDDGFLAGDVSAVSRALHVVQTRAAAIGLQLNLAKSELIAVGQVDTGALHCHFPDALLRDAAAGSSKVRREFEFLGAAIGDEVFVRAHTADRAAKAGDLLDSLGELEDPQVALRLLRSCAGFARLLHSMRCNPPSPQTLALDMFDGMVRRCFGDFTGLHLTASQWKQASLGFAHAGLGLRSTSHHAPAAYLASWAGTLRSASDIDASFSVEESKASPAVVAALAAFNAQVDAARAIAIDAALASKQQALSHALDAASWNEQLAHASPTDRATLLSEASVGGRAFLSAIPSGRTQMEPAVFVAEVRARLRVAEADNDAWCPLCDAVLDCHGYHAGMCAAGGERTQRHHAVRDLVYEWCKRGGLRPERERPGLLLPNHPEDVANNAAGRRPADVYLPAFAGAPTAFDFAITAPQRQESLALASQQAGAAAEAYARHKELHLGTSAACQAQGVKFVPMVAECSGSWDAAALKILFHLACAVATRTGEDSATCSSLLLQQLCVSIRSYRARAALRRRSAAL